MAEKNKGGRPRKFEDGKHLIELFRRFNRYVIRDREYEIVPTQTNFCEWLDENYKATDRKTIYNSLHKYFPNIKKDFEQILSDTCTQGAMIGKYQPAMTIFALKNWCKWTDKQDIIVNGDTDYTGIVEIPAVVGDENG